jgi:hypothetical protein
MQIEYTRTDWFPRERIGVLGRFRGNGMGSDVQNSELAMGEVRATDRSPTPIQNSGRLSLLRQKCQFALSNYSCGST